MYPGGEILATVGIIPTPKTTNELGKYHQILKALDLLYNSRAPGFNDNLSHEILVIKPTSLELISPPHFQECNTTLTPLITNFPPDLLGQPLEHCTLTASTTTLTCWQLIKPRYFPQIEILAPSWEAKVVHLDPPIFL